MNNYIKGIFKQSIYQSDKGYIIGLFKVLDTDMDSMVDYINKTITITGYFHELSENEKYFFKGEESFHPKYGFQFNVHEYERVKPDDKDGIIEFLASDLFKGVGEKLATKIVETLGPSTLDKILEDKESLKSVPKLTLKKIDEIYNTLTKYEESHKTIVSLTELGFVMRDALSIYNTYKNNTMNIIEHNIYRVITDIEELNFNKVDMIAKKMDIDPKSENRIRACILYVMQELTFKNGDTYLSLPEIYEGVCHTLMLDLDIEYIEELLSELSGEMQVHIEANKYYLSEIFEAEYTITNKINMLLNKPITKYKDIDSKINKLEEKFDIKYNDSQKEAVIKALENNILIITGGPGTGKTTIIKGIVELYKMINKFNNEELTNALSLLAPTGRASKRMTESTLLPASTIHRFLKWNRESNTFGVDEYNPDFSNLIIIDEVSMIDINLMSNLLKGLTSNIKLVLVGDYNQLPSVGPGMILKDLIDSNIIDTINLKMLYRQSEESYIPTLASEIREDSLTEFLSQKEDYTFLSCSSNYIVPNLIKVCRQVIDKGYDYKRMQVMAPMYAGVNGIDNLNRELQAIFNPPSNTKKEIKYGDIIFRENDKVLQLVNMPDDNVFNGDIGIIIGINSASTSKSGKNELVIDFDGSIITIQPKDFINIKHGYIISIHKAQGSEFELVIMPVCRGYQRMLYRKLIYTGITRAKKKLILIGEPDAFTYSVHNNHEQSRKTDLLEKLLNTCIKNE